MRENITNPTISRTLIYSGLFALLEATQRLRINYIREELKSLYDVFLNIRDDEKEHWMSLCNIVQYGEMGAVNAAKVKSTNEKEKK